MKYLALILLFPVLCAAQTIGRGSFYTPTALPTFIVGDSTIEATTATGASGNYYETIKIPMTTKGAVLSASVFFHSNVATRGGASLYTHKAATNLADSLIAATDTNTTITSPAWVTFTFTSPPNVQSDTVWLGVQINGAATFVNVTDATGRRILSYMTKGGLPLHLPWPTAWVSGGTQDANKRFSMYLTVQP